jgi:uncharacterized membrane protein
VTDDAEAVPAGPADPADPVEGARRDRPAHRAEDRRRRPAEADDARPVPLTADDPLAAAYSHGVGGPIGTHAGRHPWWTPLRVVLALTALCCALGFVSKTPCYQTSWGDNGVRYSDLCYSDLPYLYVGRGFAELEWPYTDSFQVRDRYEVMEYPVGISYYAWAAAQVTHWLAGFPNLAPRGGLNQDQLSADPQVRRETLIFTAVNAVGFAVCALVAAWCLAGVHRRRPWDAVLFAASPVLLFEGLINWDLLAVVCVAGALYAHARGRPVLTGVMIGLGTAMKLYPLFLLGALAVIWGRDRRWGRLVAATLASAVTWVVVNAPAYLTGSHAWTVFWTFNAHRGADLGSVWLMVGQMTHHTASAHTINVVSWVFFLLWCAAVAVLGTLAPETPRLSQLGFLLVVGFLLVNKVYSPQYALWLLPLAVMARPRWRDQLIWQGAEVFYFAAVWWYLAGYLNPGGGGDAGLYWVAIVLRLAGELWLTGVVVRDVLKPQYDVVRMREWKPRRRRPDLALSVRRPLPHG